MKFRILLKDLTPEFDTFDGSYAKEDKLRKAAEPWLEYGDCESGRYLTIEIDPIAGTCIVIPAKKTMYFSGRKILVSDIRRVAGGTVCFVERHPSENDWPWTTGHWTANIANLSKTREESLQPKDRPLVIQSKQSLLQRDES